MKDDDNSNCITGEVMLLMPHYENKSVMFCFSSARLHRLGEMYGGRDKHLQLTCVTG